MPVCLIKSNCYSLILLCWWVYFYLADNRVCTFYNSPKLNSAKLNQIKITKCTSMNVRQIYEPSCLIFDGLGLNLGNNENYLFLCWNVFCCHNSRNCPKNWMIINYELSIWCKTMICLMSQSSTIFLCCLNFKKKR